MIDNILEAWDGANAEKSRKETRQKLTGPILSDDGRGRKRLFTSGGKKKRRNGKALFVKLEWMVYMMRGRMKVEEILAMNHHRHKSMFNHHTQRRLVMLSTAVFIVQG